MSETPIRETKEGFIYPASPTLIKNNLPHLYDKFIEVRKGLIKPTDKIYDSRLRDYQNEDVDLMIRRESNGLFNQQRLGKTPTVLTSIKYKQIRGKILIVSPKTILSNWVEEVEKWLGYSVKKIKGTKEQRKEIYKSDARVLVGTYTTVALDYDYLPKFDCIVVDEAHRLRNFKGTHSDNSPMFTKKLMEISYEATHKYVITGTPCVNYAWDIYPLLHMMYPKIFSSYHKFLEYYFEQEVIYTKNDSIKKPVGFKDKTKELELQEFLETTCIQRKRKDHMKWLPPVDFKDVILTLDKKEKLWYNELKETFECRELGINCPSLLSLMMASRKITTFYGPKEKYILDYIEEYPEKQIIIVSFFSEYLKQLHKKIPNSELLIGESSEAKRHQIEKDFNNRKFPILLGNIHVMSEGMKLEQGNTIIVIDPALEYEINNQLYDRIIPTTPEVALEKDSQEVIRLMIDDTIDMYLKEMLETKASSSDIINNFKKYIGK